MEDMMKFHQDRGTRGKEPFVGKRTSYSRSHPSNYGSSAPIQGRKNHRQEPPRGENRGCLFEKSLIYQYPNFMGIEGALRANKWLIDVKMTFDISGCMEEQNVQYVGHLLQGEDGIWRDTKRQLLIREPWVWGYVALSYISSYFNHRPIPSKGWGHHKFSKKIKHQNKR